MKIKIYTDASFDHSTKYAVVGYVVLVDGKLKKHILYDYAGILNPTHAELMAIIIALQDVFELYDPHKIILYSDCLPAFPLRKKQTVVKQLSEYRQDLDDTIEVIRDHGIEVGILHVAGHSNDKYNTMVDISVRRRIRELRNTLLPKNNFSL